MVKSWQYWSLSGIGALCVIGMLLSVGLTLSNNARQAELTRRNQYIQQSIQLQTLYQEIVRALADLSVRNKDPQLRELLARQGFTVNPAPPAATTLEAAKAPAAPTHEHSP